MVPDKRMMASAIITDLKLPSELTSAPIRLAHFAAGYGFFKNKEYRAALDHLDAGLKHAGDNRQELADMRSLCRSSCWLLARDQRVSAYLRRPIEDFTAVLNVYEEENSLEKWAATQNNLGPSTWTCRPATGRRTLGRPLHTMRAR